MHQTIHRSPVCGVIQSNQCCNFYNIQIMSVSGPPYSSTVIFISRRVLKFSKTYIKTTQINYIHCATVIII